MASDSLLIHQDLPREVMDNRTTSYLSNLKNRVDSRHSQLWMYRAIFGATLSAVWSDLEFVHDFGIEKRDLELLNSAMRLASKLIFSGKAPFGRSQEHFEDFWSRLNSWDEARFSNRMRSYWNLKRVKESQRRLARLGGRYQEDIASLNLDDMEKVLAAFLEIGQKSPGTFYTLYRLSDYFEKSLDFPVLERDTTHANGIVRIVSASFPLFKLLRRNEEAIYQLSPSAFEDLVAERLEEAGMQVWRPSGTNVSDGGVDLLASPTQSPFPFLIAVQAKHHVSRERKTGPAPVKEMQSIINNLPLHAGMIVTNTQFTQDAKWWAAKSQGKVQLQDIFQVRNWIANDFQTGRLQDMPNSIQLTPRLKVKIW